MGLCVGLHSPDGCLLFSPGQSLGHKGWWRALTPFFLLTPGAFALLFWAGSWSLSPTPSCSLFLTCGPNLYIGFTVFPFLLFCSKGGFKPSHVLTSRPESASTCRLYGYSSLFWLNSEMPLHPSGLAFSVLTCCGWQLLEGNTRNYAQEYRRFLRKDPREQGSIADRS